MSRVVSFRVSFMEKHRLDSAARSTGKTVGDVVRIILADKNVVRLIEAAAERGRKEAEAVWHHKAYRRCKVCHNEVVIDFTNNPRAAMLFEKAFEHWVHGECARRRVVH